MDTSKIRSLADVPRHLTPKEQGQVILRFLEMGMPEAAATYARGLGMPEVADHVLATAEKVRADIQAQRVANPQGGATFTHHEKGLRMEIGRDYSLRVFRLSDSAELDPKEALSPEEHEMVTKMLREGYIAERMAR